MAMQKNITLNNGDVIAVPACAGGYGVHYQEAVTGDWETEYITGLTNTKWWYEDGVSAPITWLNLQDTVANSHIPAYNFYDRYRDIIEGMSEMDDTFEAYMDDIDENNYFIWGSAREGGCFIHHQTYSSTLSNNIYYIGIIRGIYQNDDDEYYLDYDLKTNSTNYNTLENVGFFIYNNQQWNGSTYVDNYMDLSVYMIGDKSEFISYKNMATTAAQSPSYSEMTARDPVIGTGDPFSTTNLVGNPPAPLTLVKMPNRAWYYSGHTNNYTFDFVRSSNTDTHIMGDLWEGMFEPDAVEEGGISSTGGGYGIPSNDSDDISGESASSLNQLSAINSGLVTLFNPTKTELMQFSSWLYTGITDSIATQLKKLVTNPLDYIIFVALAKFQPNIDGERDYISFCGVSSGVSANLIKNQFQEIDCGSIDIDEQFQSFLDYSPHSKIKLYLPFCGIKEIQIDDTMHGRINVNYLIDLLSGSCIARVKVTRSSRDKTDPSINSVLYEFNGNVYLTMPISGSDWRGFYSSLMSLVGGVSNGLAGNIPGALGSVASAVTSQKVSVGRSGDAGSAYGYMGNKYPYLILERPIVANASRFGEFQAFKSNMTYSLNRLNGFTKVNPNNIISMNINATDGEINEIKELLEGGVIL